MNNTEKLLQLIKENPELPIVPMVDYEIVGDGYGRWLGSFGYCDVGEYACFDDRFYNDREEFKDDYFGWHDEELKDKFNYNPWITDYTVGKGEYTQDELMANNHNEKMLEDYLDKIADDYFIKAIIVDIDLP